MASINTASGVMSYVHTIEYWSKYVDQSGPGCTVQYKIDNYSDVDNFIGALVGQGTRSGGANGVTIRNVPHRHPLEPGLACISARMVQPLGHPVLNANGYPNYDGGALIQAEYRAPNLDFGPVADQLNSFDANTSILWATQELDFGSEVFTIFPNEFKFSSGPLATKTTGVPAKITIPITTMLLTFHKLPYMPMAAVRAKVGCVNDDVFLGAAAGCVHFKGAKTSRDFNDDGSVVQKVQLVFEERPSRYPWNSLPSRTSLVWYPVTDDGTGGGNKMFTTASLTSLVQF